MSLKRRLFGNIIAAGGSVGWSAIMQLVSVPVLLPLWGAERYGSWLMLTTIPSYFALSDFGFAAAATSEMTMLIARGERDAALVTFQSLWRLIFTVIAVILTLTSPLLIIGLLADGSSPWWQAHSVTLFILIAYAGATQCSRIVLAAHRSSGHYALGTMVYDVIQFVEGMIVLLLAFLGSGFAVCAAGYLAVRLCNSVIMALLLKRNVPWMQIGIAHAHTGELKRLLQSAIAAMTIPVALAINIQGMILVVGSMISPVAAAVLGPVRTVSRVAVQAVGIINRASMPEVSTAHSQGSQVSLEKLVRLNLLSVAVILLPGVILFACFGVSLVRLWTYGHIVPTVGFIVLMAIATFFNGCWTFASNMLLAINKLVQFSRRLMFVSVGVIAVAVPAARYYGLIGVATALVVAEFTTVVIALLIAYPILKQVQKK